MTKRAVIITSSVIVAILMTLTILFGVVFRVRKIDVVKANNFYYSVDADEILSASKLKKNVSIFDINKDEIIGTLETEYPYARVGFNLTGFTSVKLTLSNREPIYYFVQEGVYYILDEDCKILDFSTNISVVENLIRLENIFSATENTKAGEFLNNKYSSVCNNLYSAIYTNATIEEFDDERGEYIQKYLDKKDMAEVVSSIKFSQVDELNGRMDKLHIITTYGIEMTIIEPQKDLDEKINRAFSVFRTLQQMDRQDSGTRIQGGFINIIYNYDKNGHTHIISEYRA